MSSFRTGQILILLSTLAIVPAFGTTTHHASKKIRHRISRIHGQRVIDSNRAAEIQNALIQKKYLSGAASGQWDGQTQEAMRQYQSDHGWQTRLTPDSRALISLGLGPSHVEDASVHTANVSPAAIPAAAKETTDQAQSSEPVPNSLASVHSLAQ